MASRLEQLVDRIADLLQTQIIDQLLSIESYYDVNRAVGYFLNLIGVRFNFSRPRVGSTLATDVQYRRYLKGRAAQLLTDGTAGNMETILQRSLDANGQYIDNGNMSVDVTLPSVVSDDELNTIVDNGLITKPAGVRIGLVYAGSDVPVFGFNGAGSTFNSAPFGRTTTVGD